MLPEQFFSEKRKEINELIKIERKKENVIAEEKRDIYRMIARALECEADDVEVVAVVRFIDDDVPIDEGMNVIAKAKDHKKYRQLFWNDGEIEGKMCGSSRRINVEVGIPGEIDGRPTRMFYLEASVTTTIYSNDKMLLEFQPTNWVGQEGFSVPVLFTSFIGKEWDIEKPIIDAFNRLGAGQED